MGGHIQSSAEASTQAACALQTDLGAYCSCDLASLSLAAPVGGSADHDGRLIVSFAHALEAFGSLISFDARTVVGIHASLAEADEQVAGSI